MENPEKYANWAQNTEQVQTKQRTTKKMNNMDPTKKIWKWIQELVKDEQFMFLIRHSYTNLFKSGNNIVGGREKKNLHKREKIHCHLRFESFLTVNSLWWRP